MIALRYDRDYGYADHHLMAMMAAKGRDFGPLPVDLAAKGFEIARAFPAEHAREILSRLDPNEGIVRLLDDSFDFLRWALHPACEGEIGSRLRALFRSEFSVTGIAFRRKIGGVSKASGKPGDAYEKSSAFWHCDGGPTTHVKVLIYLAEASAHDGGTAYIDRSTTELFKAAGYLFPASEDRTMDLHGDARKAGFDYRETLLKPECGEAIIFQPSTTLHRARLPERGERVTMTLLCLPSAKSWAERIREEHRAVLDNHSCGFPPLQGRLQLS